MVKLSVLPVDNDKDKLILTLRKVLQQIQKANPTWTVLPWSTTDETFPAISKLEHLPLSIGKLRHYFPQITPRTQGGNVYSSICLGTMLTHEALGDKLGWWLKAQKFGLGPCELQLENPQCLGWFLYSLGEHDLAILKPAISAAIGCRIGLQWRAITKGANGQAPQAEKPRAVYIEVDRADGPRARHRLCNLYSKSTGHDFPLGLHLCYVPEIGPHMSGNLQAKMDRLGGRQASYVRHVIKAQTWDIAVLDFTDHRLQCSLREIVATIPSREKPHLPLFHSIDRLWNRAGTVVSILPCLESEARMVLAGLLPFLRATHESQCNTLGTCFTPIAVEGAEEAKWDIVAHCLVTPDDRQIQAALDDDIEFDLSHMEPTQLMQALQGLTG